MKFSLQVALLCLATITTGTFAFTIAPQQRAAFGGVQQTARTSASFPLLLLRAVENASNEEAPSSMSLEEEVELMVQEEKTKTLRMSKMSGKNGVEYAPWMNMTPEDEARIRSIAREKTEARRKRQMQQQTVSGSLAKDSTNQELSGTGLRSKVIGGDSVELEWATGSEKNTKGFIVKRRATKTPDFVTIASYETHGPLATKGVDGGVYRYLDEGVGVGGWVYRITEKESSGQENDLSQCLVEIETAAEQKGQVLALAGFGIIALAALAAGTLLDPVQ